MSLFKPASAIAAMCLAPLFAFGTTPKQKVVLTVQATCDADKRAVAGRKESMTQVLEAMTRDGGGFHLRGIDKDKRRATAILVAANGLCTPPTENTLVTLKREATNAIAAQGKCGPVIVVEGICSMTPQPKPDPKSQSPANSKS